MLIPFHAESFIGSELEKLKLLSCFMLNMQNKDSKISLSGNKIQLP